MDPLLTICIEADFDAVATKAHFCPLTDVSADRMLRDAPMAASTGRTAALKCVVNVGSGPEADLPTRPALGASQKMSL
jgi:hypothetical protein